MRYVSKKKLLELEHRYREGKVGDETELDSVGHTCNGRNFQVPGEQPASYFKK